MRKPVKLGNYRLKEEAEADLERIWFYGLEHWGLAAANEYYAGFFEHFEQLAAQPLLYPAVDDIHEGYRRDHGNHWTAGRRQMALGATPITIFGCQYGGLVAN